MLTPLSWNRNRAFALALAAALLAGFWLRWHLLADQVLGDDEWHGFYYALGKSPWWLLTHFSIPGATCIPLNFYSWLLGATVGWSEIWLRLPSLVGGVAIVAAGPWLAREIIGTRRAGLLAGLLAVSPLLIFYSRICRPYSAVALLAFASLLFAARWLQSGGRRSAALFAVTGVLAIYFHLFAAVTVAAPMLAGLILLIHARLFNVGGRTAVGPSLREWLLAASILVVGGGVLVLPALIHSLQSTFFNIALAGKLSFQSLPKVAELISGTGQPLLAILFWAAFVAGAVEQCRRNPRFGWMLVSLYPLHALALILSRPDSAQSGIVLARYCIPLVPVTLLLVACGIQAALEAAVRNLALQTSIAVAALAALALAGPLPQCYVAPNNFTSHGAYQHRYGNIDWQKSFVSDLTPADFTLVTAVRAEEISPFYQWLQNHPGSRPVVEFPMLIGDHFNPLYYYQHFHRRPVLVGYVTDLAASRGLAPGNIYGNTYIDQVLSLVPDPARLHFQNLVAMDNVATLRGRGAEFVILHKQFEAQLPAVALPLPDLARLQDKFRRTFGEPFYEDAHIAVFRL